MSFKLDISNWGIYKRIKALDIRKYLVFIKNLNGSSKLIFACVAMLLAIIPLNLVLSGGAGVKPTNVNDSPAYVAQLSVSASPAAGEKTITPNNTDSPAPTAAAKSQDLGRAIQQAAIKDALGIAEKANTSPTTSPESTSVPNSGSTTTKSQSVNESDVDVYTALNNLTDILTNMPDSHSLLEQSQVASVKAEKESATPTDAGAEQAAADKIDAIQDQLNSISVLVSGEGVANESDSNNPNDQPGTTDDSAVANANQQASPEASTPAGTTSPEPSGMPQDTAAATQIPRSSVPDTSRDEEDQDVDDETALITLDILPIPTSPVSDTASEEEANIEAFIEVALAQVGKPYSTGGKGPDRFDCSGFVFYSLNTSGYSIEYMTSSTWANADFTTINSIDEMLRGDIICLSGHVAIYLGDGVMVDASSKNGQIVVRDVGAWCRNNFKNAKRIWTVPEQTEAVPKDVIELNIVE